MNQRTCRSALSRMAHLTSRERHAYQGYCRLKKKAGSHAPSVHEVLSLIPPARTPLIDACMLSNPYAARITHHALRALFRTPESLGVSERYPSHNLTIAQHLVRAIDIPAEHIVPAHGTTPLIEALFQHVLAGPTLLPLPTFSPYYEYATRRAPATFHYLREQDGFLVAPEAIVKHVRQKRIRNVIFINPNNPNGGYLPPDRLRALVAALAPHIDYFILDESFTHFKDAATPSISRDLFRACAPHVIIIKSLSKEYGIAGLRAGYAVMPAPVAHALRPYFLWSVSGPAEFFFTLFEDAGYLSQYARARKKYLAVTKTFFETLTRLPHLRTFPTWANFVLAKLPPGYDADLFAFLMLSRYGVYLRSAGDKKGLRGNRYLRISSRTTKENAVTLRALRSLLPPA